MNTLIDIVKKQFEGINLKEYVELVAYITSPTYFVGKKTFKILEKKGKNRHFATMVGLFGALITAEMSAAIYAKAGFSKSVYDKNNVAIYENVIDTNDARQGMLSFLTPYNGLLTLALTDGFKVHNRENYMTCFYRGDDLNVTEKFESVHKVDLGNPYKITLRNDSIPYPHLEKDGLDSGEAKAMFAKRAKDCEELVSYSFTQTFSPYFPTTVKGATDLYRRNVSFSANITAIKDWDEAILSKYPSLKNSYNRLILSDGQDNLVTCDILYIKEIPEDLKDHNYLNYSRQGKEKLKRELLTANLGNKLLVQVQGKTEYDRNKKIPCITPHTITHQDKTYFLAE